MPKIKQETEFLVGEPQARAIKQEWRGKVSKAKSGPFRRLFYSPPGDDAHLSPAGEGLGDEVPEPEMRFFLPFRSVR